MTSPELPTHDGTAPTPSSPATTTTSGPASAPPASTSSGTSRRRSPTPRLRLLRHPHAPRDPRRIERHLRRTITIPDPAATTPAVLTKRDFSCSARDITPAGPEISPTSTAGKAGCLYRDRPRVTAGCRLGHRGLPAHRPHRRGAQQRRDQAPRVRGNLPFPSGSGLPHSGASVQIKQRRGLPRRHPMARRVHHATPVRAPSSHHR
jgi:hypothetical protein